MENSYLKGLIGRLKFNPLSQKNKNKRGVALILAMTSLMFMVYIASELTLDTSIEYIVNSQELNRLKAYYTARNSMQIALLRVKLFQQATKITLPESLANQVDLIWKFPFAWPIPIKDVNAVDRDSMTQIMKESLVDNQSSYTHNIDDEGSKVDINDLASPSKTLREVTKKQLLNVFEQKLANDDEFRTNYQSFRFEDLVNHIVDWMSDSSSAVNGGDKKQAFNELGSEYPPNRGFRTIEELRLIPGMTEEFFNLLKTRITIYGMKAINPNTASKEVLMSLDPGMTEEAVKEAVERRDDPQKGGPFKGTKDDECMKDFKGFVESRGARLAKEFEQIPMICNKVFNFRIVASGLYGSGKAASQQTITAVVLDLNKSAQQIKTFVDKDKQKEQPQQPQQPTPGQKNPPQQPSSSSGNQNQEPLPKGPPRVVYWSEN